MLYTPDCSKILIYVATTDNKIIIFYLDASDGSVLATAYKDNCCPYINNKEGIITT